MNQPGEWKNQDMGNGSVMIQLKLQSKGPSTNAIKDTVAKSRAKDEISKRNHQCKIRFIANL